MNLELNLETASGRLRRRCHQQHVSHKPTSEELSEIPLVSKVTILSTMLADRGLGEWGFSALVEVDGKKLLYDPGARPNTVLENAKELGLDLSDVQNIVLSHFHDDHTSGLMTMRRELARRNPSRVVLVG